MNTVYVHIDERLRLRDMGKLRKELMDVPHVSNVETNPRQPHDLLVEFEENHNVPMQIQRFLHDRGLHSDITSC
jgi:hypothetical protein